MERRPFSKEFKLEAVRLVVAEKRPLARELGIGVNLLRGWRTQLAGQGAERAFAGNGKVSSQDGESRRLRRELEQARQENTFLKKAAAYFAKESR